MAENERAIQVEGLAFDIPANAVAAMLRGEGVDVRLSGLKVRVSEAALNALLARFAPPTGTLQAKLSTKGVTVDRRDGNKGLRIEVASNQIRLSVADGEMRVESE